jgi:hypothetical protein
MSQLNAATCIRLVSSPARSGNIFVGVQDQGDLLVYTGLRLVVEVVTQSPPLQARR